MKWLIILALVIRLILSTFPGFETDQIDFRFWSQRLVEVGPANFYSQQVFTNNPLGFLYALWIVGEIKTLFLPDWSFTSTGFDILTKLPSNLADILAGIIIYGILKQSLKGWQAKAGFLLYALNPATVFNSAVFGQYDGLAISFMVLATYLILIKGRYELASISYAIALVTKPQAIFLAPALGLLVLTSAKPIKWLTSGISFVLSIILLYLPFFPSNPISGLLYVNTGSAGLFTCTTCFGFNLWGIWGNWQNDLAIFAGLPLVWWGIVLLSFSLILILFRRNFRQTFKKPYFYLTAAVSTMAFFILLTRMHERYVLYSLPFLLLTSFCAKSKFLISLFAFVTFLMFFNLYYPYSYYAEHMSPTTGLTIWLGQNFHWLSFISISCFIILLVYHIFVLRRANVKA